MLYLIGLGLWDEKDLSFRAIDAAKDCDAVYLEQYTGIWHGSVDALEKTISKKISMLDREKVESDFLINEARNKKIALLIPGDPLAATTHFELFHECRKQNIECIVIHSSSIYTAVALTGLQLYKFGRATTFAKPQKSYSPESPYDVIAENKKSGLHTLVLLDTAEGGMTVKEGIELLKMMEEKRHERLIDGRIIAAARLGSDDPIIKYGHAADLMINEKPAVIIIPGKLNFKEEEALELWKLQHNGEKIVIRNATENDLDEMVELDKKYYGDYGSDKKYFLKKFESFPDGFLVVEENRKLTGIMFFEIMNKDEIPEDFCDMVLTEKIKGKWMYTVIFTTKTNYKDKPGDSKLLEAAERIAKSKGCGESCVPLTINHPFQNNGVFEFWEMNGYRNVGEIKWVPKADETFECYFFKKELVS